MVTKKRTKEKIVSKIEVDKFSIKHIFIFIKNIFKKFGVK